MLNIPINHKTIFLFDHSVHFNVKCGHTFDFDVINKIKPQTNTSNQPVMAQLKPLDKTIWSCLIESAIEFSRIVYDIFPENKLIGMIASNIEKPLNNWNEQGLDHLMNVMGTVHPPLQNLINKEEESLNLYKSVDTALNFISQVSQLQQNLLQKHTSNETIVPNSGRIILFTPTSFRNIEKIQDILNTSIIECNKRIEKAKNLKFIKIKKVELVIVDVVSCLQENQLVELQINNSDFLKTRIFTSKAGRFLPVKMLELVQKFYCLSVTSITNIPMKEELNANSSANYDVEILHERSVHYQLKVCNILKNSISRKDGLDIISLKWSNPKTSINEFNFSSCSYRITPTDVNSRPAGRCVVLEAKSTNNATKIASHVLCNYGNEIFMHCLNICGKSNLDDRQSISENLNEAIYRTNDFNEFVKMNKIMPTSINENPLLKIFHKIERQTRIWPLSYNRSLIANINSLKPLFNAIHEEIISVNDYNECIKCIESLNNLEAKNESLVPSMISAAAVIQCNLKTTDEQYAKLWNELESWLKHYENLSERHKRLYDFVNSKLKLKSINVNEMNEISNSDKLNINNKRSIPIENNFSKISYENTTYDNEKINKKQRVDILPFSNSISLLELWTNNLKKQSKPKKEFYGRLNQQTILYSHLKLDELNAKPFSSKMNE